MLRTACAAGLGMLMRAWNRRRLTILMFHGFTDTALPGLVNCEHKHLSTERFESFLQFLKKHYQVLEMTDATGRLARGEALPAGAVVLTFDDGFLSNFTHAYPLLLRYKMPATIFLATEFVDEKKPIWVDRIVYAHDCAGKSKREMTDVKNRLKQLHQEDIEEYLQALENSLGFALKNTNDEAIAKVYHALDWEQIREMQASGLVTIGAHTHAHKILGHCRSLETVRAEMARSKVIIERETGRECGLFCYPNGGHGDFSAATEAVAKEVGFRSTLTAVGGWQSCECSPFLLKRFGITNDIDLTKFSLTMCGFLPWLYQKKA